MGDISFVVFLCTVNKTKACILLDISQDATVEELEEAFEGKYFELRNRFLVNGMSLLLMGPAIEKVRELLTAYSLLGSKQFKASGNRTASIGSTGSLLELLAAYSEEISRLKLELMQVDPLDSIEVLTEMKDLMFHYYRGLSEQDYEDVEVRISGAEDPMLLHRAASSPKPGEEELMAIRREVSRARKTLARFSE